MASRSNPPTLLAFVDDPGAANMAAFLPETAEALGHWRLRLYARGMARRQLDILGCPWSEVEDNIGAAGLIDREAPTVVVVGTSEDPRSLGLELVRAARDHGVASFGLVDGPANPGQRFCGTRSDPLAFAPDVIVVPDETTTRNFVSLGREPGTVHALGHPMIAHVRRRHAELLREGQSTVRRRVLPKIPEDRRLIVFLAELSDGLNPGQFRKSGAYTMHGRGRSDFRTGIVLEDVLDALKRTPSDAALVLRLHPKMTPDMMAEYAHEVAGISQGGDPLELVFAADIVIGMTTSLLIEAAVMGCTTLSVIPRPEEVAWLGEIGQDLIPRVSTRDMLDDTLGQWLSEPPPPHEHAATELRAFGGRALAETIARFLPPDTPAR